MSVDVLSDPAAERAVLAGSFRYGAECFVDVDDLVTERSFTVDSNRVIFKCLKHLFEQDADAKPDVSTLLAAANTLGLSDAISAPEEKKHLRAVIQMPVERQNVRRLAGKVRKLEVARELGGQLEQAQAELEGVTGDEAMGAILGIVENRIFDFSNLLSKAAADGPRQLGEGLDAWLAHLAQNPVQQMGISTPFPLWDQAVGGGLRPGTVNTFGARPKTGKTMAGITIARHVAGALGHPALYLDTEMQDADHRVRNLAALSGVPMRAIETGQFAEDLAWRPKVEAAAEALKAMPYDMMSIAGQPFEETVSVMRRWLHRRVGFRPNGKANPCVIVFDYLKLMESTGLSKHLQEFQLLGFIMTGLHNFAVKYGVPIVLFVQLNRDGIDVENSTAASGSDRIIWLCSNFTIYKKLGDGDRDEVTAAGVKYNRKLVVTDCRHGPGLEDGQFIYVRAEMDIARITEGPLQKELGAAAAGKPFNNSVGVVDFAGAA